MVTAGEAASDFNSFYDLLHVGVHHVQQYCTSDGSVQYLNQKVVSGLQESPGLLWNLISFSQ